MTTPATGWICSSPLYRYHGWTFEYPAYCAPWPCKQDGDPRARAGRRFYTIIAQFNRLTPSKKARCRIGGGCQKF